jgi:choline dehydrogenase
MGAAVAYFVRLLDPAAEVCVIERDPAYDLASTPRASGGVRRLFSLPENIELSRYSIDFFAGFPEAMAVDAQPADIGLRRDGYLFIVPPSGLGTTNFFETGAFLRTRDDVPFPNMQYEFLPLTRQLRNGRLVPVPGFQFWLDLSRPESRGAVTLKSASPADPPSVVFRHLGARQDIADLVAGVRLARALVRQAAWDKYRGAELSPGPDVVTDSDTEAWIRKRTSTSYHPSGTCRMGGDAESVVDGEGRVRAVPRLRIADASIMPQIITGNLNAPVLMMAEKIADRIRGLPPLPPSAATYYRAAS